MLDGVPNEIVIVRRKHGWDDDEKPHGVWKIAYADFMTALMAFFLVMWLINVTDDSVRKGVAQYFNPVKLASTAPNRKGLNDPSLDGETNENGEKLFKGKLGGTDKPAEEGDNLGEGIKYERSATGTKDQPDRSSVPATGQFTQIHAESILFSDPYAVLDTLSEKIRVVDSQEDNPQGIGSGMRKNQGVQGGQAYRDPFDPMFWQFRPGRGVDSAGQAAQPLAETDRNGAGPAEVELEGVYAWGAPFEEGQSRAPGQIEEQSKPDATDLPDGEGSLPAEETASGFEKAQTDPIEPDAKSANPVIAHVMGRSSGSSIGAMETSEAEAVEIESETVIAAEPDGDPEEILVTRLSDVLESTEGTVLEETARQITVTRADEGTLISLTDDQDFGMFAIGSAEPRPELVKLLERIGKVVSEAPGRIVIKGHTDARPFRNKAYDNWRLSSARAHMALYMLSRGGVAKDRFERVEGYADRDLKTPTDPYAANNRRIEIYLLEGRD